MKRILLVLASLTVYLYAGAQAPRQIVIRFTSEDPAAVVAAVDAFEKVDIPFTMERTILRNDTPEMKEALTKVKWKNNELVSKIGIIPGVSVVDANPANISEVIGKAKAEGWKINTPSAWRQLLTNAERTFGGRNYYVSEDGDDEADGLHPDSAWRSLDKVNSTLLGYADTVRFRRGDIFRGHLEAQSGRPGEAVVYTCFGSGDKPVIEPSWDASSPEDWVKVGKKLWKCEKASRLELGNIIFNHGDKGCARKVDKPEQLQGRDRNFCWVEADKAVYLVSRRNPGRRFASIELAEKQHIIVENNCHDIVYDGLWLRYGAAHGIGGGNVSRVNVQNCDISWIGGSTLYYDDGGRGVRYGNGIEFWGNASDLLVENCRVWECWDAALTNQSNVVGAVQKNITYRNNEIWNSEYSYEYWQQGDAARTENIVFENNVCRDAGYGWGHTQRWNPNAGHLMFYDTTAETDGFIIRGNRFERTKDCGIRLFNAWYPRWTMENNTWRIPANYICRYHGRPTSDLIYKYPDHLDRIHDDNEAEIQSQTVEEPLRIRHGRRGLCQFNEKFCR